jgi:phosphoglycolate phosphatase-like HAD superfamily hydrolase
MDTTTTDMIPAQLRCLAVDSDGCVIDSMTVKHRECFLPAIIETWGLQAVAAEAREIEFSINLYSEHRGLNRFIALNLFFEQLVERLGKRAKGIALPDTAPLGNWLESTPAFSEAELQRAIAEAEQPLPILEDALRWSRSVNLRVDQLPTASPFASAAELLRKQHGKTSIWVVSSANHEALEREWVEAGLAALVDTLAGQESGSKTAILKRAAAEFGAENVLMVGDANADHTAAQEAGVSFFRIRAGEENENWQELSSLI